MGSRKPLTESNNDLDEILEQVIEISLNYFIKMLFQEKKLNLSTTAFASQ